MLESSRSSCGLTLAVVRLHSVLTQYEFYATKTLSLAQDLGGPFVFSVLVAKPEVSVVLGALDESRTRPMQMGDEEGLYLASTGVGGAIFYGSRFRVAIDKRSVLLRRRSC